MTTGKPAGQAIRKNVPLHGFNSFRVPATAACLAQPRTTDELQAVLDQAVHCPGPLRVIGGGTNLLIVDDLPGLLLQPALEGIKWLGRAGEGWLLRVGAGICWHELVCHCVARNRPGLENLALIPGTVGAAPVQNIGAYGSQFSDVCDSVEAVDLNTGKSCSLSAADCRFGYRDSRFRQEPGRWVITSVTLRLPDHFAPRLDYPGLIQALGSRATAADLSPAEVADAVIRVRQSKLPGLGPDEPGSAGSFFKNPVVALTQVEALQARWPKLPCHPLADGSHGKLSAGWMIDALGYKGFRVGDAGVYARHALVLVNHGQATGRELLALAREIQNAVQAEFGVWLEPEPLIWPEPV